MIIMMQTSYSTIHVGDHVYHYVSERTWQCYVAYIKWARDEYRTVVLGHQGGWAIKIEEAPTQSAGEEAKS